MVYEDNLSFETLAAQAGLRVRVGDTISTAPPIDPSTTFSYDSVEDVHAALGPDPTGFAYSRNANPTVVLLEEAVAALEGAENAVAFGSGMAAIAGAFAAVALAGGDGIVAARDLYGVSRALFTSLEENEIATIYVDVFDLDAVERALARPEVRVLYFETIANPLLQVPDVDALVSLARARRKTVIVDNTFGTPYLFRALSHGVDVVVHSATKYLAGHGDVVAGVASGSSTWGKRIRGARTVTGGILSPFEAWLTLRGIRTLPIRMDRQCASAASIAAWLCDRPWIERVYYSGLQDSPHRTVADRQFGGRFGAMVAFDLAAGQREAIAFIDGLRLVTAGTSLGDVASLVLYPPLTSHRTLDEQSRAAAGIGPGLIRLSVGLESIDDLTSDLERAAIAAGIAQRTSVPA